MEWVGGGGIAAKSAGAGEAAGTHASAVVERAQGAGARSYVVSELLWGLGGARPTGRLCFKGGGWGWGAAATAAVACCI